MSKSVTIFLSLLCVSLMSCTTRKIVFAHRAVAIDEKESTILIEDTLTVKFNPFTQLSGKNTFIHNRSNLTNEIEKYTVKVLHKSISLKDSVIAILPCMIITASNEKADVNSDVSYYYYFDSNIGRGGNMQNVDKIPYSRSPFPLFFLREVFINKKMNLIIVKDRFKDISVIYTIQGRAKNAPYTITNIWYPRNFNYFISIAGYIKDKIDPISIETAKACSKRTN